MSKIVRAGLEDASCLGSGCFFVGVLSGRCLLIRVGTYAFAFSPFSTLITPGVLSLEIIPTLDPKVHK